MKNKKIYLLALLLLVCILSISAISAAENTANKEVISTDNNKETNLETNIQYDDVSTSKENCELNLEENDNDKEDKSGADETTTDNEDPLTFTNLNTTINNNNNTNSTIYLSHNYKYDNSTDENFKNGIEINRNLTIYGNGATLDGSNMARIFNVTNYNLNVQFYNINFINGKADIGGAIYGGYAYNCLFTNNIATTDGGAIFEGNAYNCTFTQNNATNYGGAIIYTDAYNCTFTDNTATYGGGAISSGNAYNCTFNRNTARKGGAIEGGNAYNCTFTQNNATEIEESPEGFGGAIYNGNATNCTFNQNIAITSGGAIYQGNAYNCTFNQNTATYGGAMYQGNATLCRFNNDTTYETNIIPANINVLNYTSTYRSGEKLNFNLTAEGKLYDGFNTTIKIYKDGLLLKTVYALTGEGWIVDLDIGEYTAELSLTDYPNEKPSNATINILNSFISLNNIINGNTNSTIYLSHNYTYNASTDENFKNGIVISRNLTIYGNGVTIDGSKTARIFNVTNSTFNVKFYNINFINGKTDNNGGAIYGGNAYDSTFTNNKANQDGGAIYQGNATNCTFSNNNAKYGGSIYQGNATNCTFNENRALEDGYGGALFSSNAYNCLFTKNTASIKGGAIHGGNAYNCTFNENRALENGYGGAIYQGNAYNCTFNKNKADSYKFDEGCGGAIAYVNAYNCTFTQNYARYMGGAIFLGHAYNCTFNGNNATKSGAIHSGNAYNCTFINNKATYGGAKCYNTADNCTFTNNTATYGGAIYQGNAILCRFNNDTTYETNIIRARINVLNYTSPYQSGEKLKFSLIADGKLYDGFNTTIAIYKDGSLFKTVYALTGEGWVVDLIPGEYTAVLNLTDYPDEQPSNTTITVLKINTTITIDPISNVNVGEEVTINYTTNSNGTATIKINNQTITGNKFTPTQSGPYTVTVELAENDYYTAATNQTTFAAQNNTTVTINPIPNVTVGQEITINYTTNSNGTATIKVNGEPITDGKFTPTQEGTYNVTIEIAENDYYTAATNQTTFTVEKTNTTILISPIIDYVVGETIPITYTTNSNGTATIKVNGEIIPDGNFTPTKAGTYNLTIEIAENDYYTAATNQTTFTVEKTNTTILISPIIDYVVGETIPITYTTNSNGTATIKVNGEIIPDGNFTPTKAGTYNLTIEIAENDYYTAATNQTTFTVEKTNTTILISPIIDYVVGETIPITYTTNSNGTATIKVNGQPVTDAKFIPTKAGTYNLTIEIQENDYYTQATNQTTFTVGKLASQIITSPITATYNVAKNLVITLKDSNGKAIKGAILTVNLGSSKKYTTDANGQVKINVATLTPKTYNAKITYDGSDNYKGSTKSVKVTVKKATPKITAKAASYKLKVKTKKYTVNFKDNKNQPLKNTKVTLKVNGKTYSVKTNSKGQGVFKITNLKKKGTYAAVITVPANTYYNKASKNVKIAVKP